MHSLKGRKLSHPVTLLKQWKVRRRTYNWILLLKMLALACSPLAVLGTAQWGWCRLHNPTLTIRACTVQQLEAKPAPTTEAPKVEPTRKNPDVKPKPKAKSPPLRLRPPQTDVRSANDFF